MPETAPLAVVYRPIGELIPYARNARTHSAKQIAEIAASIREFGFTNPVLIDPEGGIIAGHGRVLAGRELGLETVPTIALPHLSEAQRRAYVLADNQLALNAGWDEALLKIEMADLGAIGFDISIIGFPSAEEMLGSSSGPQQGGGGENWAPGGQNNGSLAERFGLPPFTILNAREGWWQARKAAWIALGLKSELGRGELDGGTVSPGRNGRSELSYGQAAGGLDAVPANMPAVGEGGLCDGYRRSRANAIPGGRLMPVVDKASGKIVRGDSRARPMRRPAAPGKGQAQTLVAPASGRKARASA